MAKTLQFRRGTSAELDAITGAEGEIFIDLDDNSIRIHDGSTVGGFSLATSSEAQNAFSNAVSYIDSELSALVNSAPGVLDTFNELAEAIGDDENFFITVNNNINTAYSNAVSEAGSLADDAFANAVSYVDSQTTDTIEEGNTNLYYLDSRVDSHLSGANGLSYSTGTISADQDISVGADVNFNSIAGLSSPSSSTDATNKQYVDEVAEGLTARTAADVLSDSNLSATYANNTLTASSNGAFPAVDDVTLDTQFDRVLVTGQSNAAHNGLYVLDVVGDGSTPWELIRCSECNEDSEIAGSFVFIQSGTVYEASGWVAIVDDPDTFTLGTDDINWTQFSGAGTFTAGEGLELNGSQFSLDSSIAGDFLTYNAGVLDVSNTDLGTSANTTSRTVTSSTGSNVVLPSATTSNAGVMTASDKSKLNGIESGATVDQTITAGSGLTGGGTGDVTLNHADTSSQSSVNNSGGTVIQDISVDTYGHVTSIGSKSLSASDVGALSTSGKAADSNLLDGINSSQFLRSDTNDTMNGTLRVSSFGVGTNPSGTTGEIRATNNITAFYSDDRLKTHLGKIENALEKVCSLNGFYFEPNETAQDLGYESNREVGVSAQEVQKILPEIVVPAPIDDKYLTVRYEKLIPILIESIKDLKSEIEILKEGQK